MWLWMLFWIQLYIWVLFFKSKVSNADCIIILTKMRFQLKMQVPTHWEIFILSSTFWLFPGLICWKKWCSHVPLWRRAEVPAQRKVAKRWGWEGCGEREWWLYFSAGKECCRGCGSSPQTPQILQLLQGTELGAKCLQGSEPELRYWTTNAVLSWLPSSDSSHCLQESDVSMQAAVAAGDYGYPHRCLRSLHYIWTYPSISVGHCGYWRKISSIIHSLVLPATNPFSPPFLQHFVLRGISGSQFHCSLP